MILQDSVVLANSFMVLCSCTWMHAKAVSVNCMKGNLAGMHQNGILGAPPI